MSSTDTLEQPRPLDRLPNELLTKILLDLPLHYLSVDQKSESGGGPVYLERLVSRRFNAVARELRGCGFELFAAPRERDFARAVKVLQLLPAGQAVECSELALEGSPRGRGLALGRWAATFPEVEGFSLKRCGQHGLEDLSSFSKLRFLSLGEIYNLELPSSIFLPGVESMDLFAISFGRPFHPITTSTFPALRRLGLDYCRVQGTKSRDEDVLPPDLVARLEYVQLADVTPDEPPRSYCPLGIDLPGQGVRILWSVSLEETLTRDGIAFETKPVPSATVARYIRLEGTSMIETSSSAVLDVARDLIAMHTQLRAVFVPSTMWEVSPSATQDERASRQAIIDHCARGGVALRTYTLSRWSLNHVPEFSAYLREEAAGALEAAAAARS